MQMTKKTKEHIQKQSQKEIEWTEKQRKDKI